MNPSQSKTSARPRRSCQNTKEKSEPHKDNLTESISKTKRNRRSYSKNNDTMKDKRRDDNKINVVNTFNERKQRNSKTNLAIPVGTVKKDVETDNVNTEMSNRRHSNSDADKSEMTKSSLGRQIIKRKARIESESSYHSHSSEELSASESDDKISSANCRSVRRSVRKSARRILDDSDELSDQSGDHSSRRSERKRKNRVQTTVQSDLSDDEIIQTENRGKEELNEKKNERKRKRGRPPTKVQTCVETDLNDDDEEVINQDPLAREETNPETQHKEEPVQDEMKNKPKRKRGRPSMKVETTVEDEEVLTQDPLALENTNSENMQRVKLLEGEMKNTPKRKRGRPSMKVQTTVETDLVDDEEVLTQDPLGLEEINSENLQKKGLVEDEMKNKPKRKRGRPSTKISVDFDDALNRQEKEDCTPKRKRGRPSNKAVNFQEEDASLGTDNLGTDNLVTCQVCHQVMSEAMFKKQHKAIHHGLCWTQHEEPIDYYNLQVVMDILSEKRRKHLATYGKKVPVALSFACGFCSEVKRSELGYYSHFLICNRSEEEIHRANIECDKCKQSIFLPHYRAHELKHLKEAEVESREIVEEPYVPEVCSGGKRSAAQRAKSKISKITEKWMDVEARVKQEDEEFDLGEHEEEEEEEEEGGEEEEMVEEVQAVKCEVEMLLNDDGPSEESEDFSDDEPTVSSGAAGNIPMSRIFSQLHDLMYVYKSQVRCLSAGPLYEDLKPAPFQCIAIDDAEDYLPRVRSSMCMKYADQDNVKIDLFSSEADTDRCILFCGGPVFAMAWCPHPLSLDRSNEYLAIASQPNMDSTHHKNITQRYKSVIQVWKFPQLTCREKENFTESPSMVFAIAHGEGAVWSLEWCPSGGYIENERLGLLAAACSSGKVLVYAIPWLDNRDKERTAHLQPVLVLQIDEYNSSPCYRVVWQRDTPHHMLYAGYGDGCVAVFHIQAEMQENNILLPINLFQAHLTEILLLTLCPNEGTFVLLTSGNDRLVKIWDLTDFTSPIQVVYQKIAPKRSTTGGFIPNLPLIMTGSDHTYFDDQSVLTVTPIREFAFSKGGLPRVPQIVSNFTMAFSPYCCSLISGNEDGKALCHNYAKGLFTREKRESPYSVMGLKLVPILEDKNTNNKEQNKQSETADVKVSSYEDVCQKYKIDLVTRVGPKVAVSDEVSDFVNITSCSWNNNVNNFQFVALGQKCGLVHILKNHSHTPFQLNKFFTSLN